MSVRVSEDIVREVAARVSAKVLDFLCQSAIMHPSTTGETK